MSKRFSIGRIDARRADILLSGNTISAKHAEISIDNGGSLSINDLGSSNGTIIVRNEKSINVSRNVMPLLSSDIVSLGGKKFSVDEILAKQPASAMPKQKPSAFDNVFDSGKKMMRCPACGSVTPLGHACVECGYRV